MGVDGRLGFLNAWLFEEAEDNIEMLLMQDMDGDGEFEWPDELVDRLTSPPAQGMFVPARETEGPYQLWFQGETIIGADSTFDVEVVAMSGEGPVEPASPAIYLPMVRAERESVQPLRDLVG